MLPTERWTHDQVFDILVNHCLVMPDASQEPRIPAGALVIFIPYAPVRCGEHVAVVLDDVRTVVRLLRITPLEAVVVPSFDEPPRSVPASHLLGAVAGITIPMLPGMTGVDDFDDWTPVESEAEAIDGTLVGPAIPIRSWKRFGRFQRREDWVTPACRRTEAPDAHP